MKKYKLAYNPDYKELYKKIKIFSYHKNNLFYKYSNKPEKRLSKVDYFIGFLLDVIKNNSFEDIDFKIKYEEYVMINFFSIRLKGRVLNVDPIKKEKVYFLDNKELINLLKKISSKIRNFISNKENILIFIEKDKDFRKIIKLIKNDRKLDMRLYFHPKNSYLYLSEIFNEYFYLKKNSLDDLLPLSKEKEEKLLKEKYIRDNFK